MVQFNSFQLSSNVLRPRPEPLEGNYGVAHAEATMTFKSLVKIAIAPFPVGAAINQLVAEIDSVETNRRLELLEDPLSEFGGDAKKLCELIYRSMPRDILTNKIPWVSELEPYLKTLRRFEANGMVAGEAVLGGNHEFLCGVRLDSGFLVYLALISKDSDLCKEMSDFMGNLPSGKGVNGKELSKKIALPLAVIDALFETYVAQGQGMKSKETGSSYYVAK